MSFPLDRNRKAIQTNMGISSIPLRVSKALADFGTTIDERITFSPTSPSIANKGGVFSSSEGNYIFNNISNDHVHFSMYLQKMRQKPAVIEFTFSALQYKDNINTGKYIIEPRSISSENVTTPMSPQVIDVKKALTAGGDPVQNHFFLTIPPQYDNDISIDIKSSDFKLWSFLGAKVFLLGVCL